MKMMILLYSLPDKIVSLDIGVSMFKSFSCYMIIPFPSSPRGYGIEKIFFCILAITTMKYMVSIFVIA